jgi:mono/diheme cytochrome c family protein
MNTFLRLRPVTRYVLSSVAIVVVLVLLFGIWLITGPGPMSFAGGETVALADYKGPNPTGVPASLAHASLVQRGEYLARAADCTACHTAPGGKPYAGGFPFHLPFGTMYSPNITPDKETGIGTWSDASFLNAIHKGIDDEGQRLYPAMPYASYSVMTDADALAIKAYLFSLAPVHAPAIPNDLHFPFNQRWAMGIWSWAFNPGKTFQPNTAHSAEWNRGAYLAEGLAHCGECHTPRNLAFALDNRSKFSGAVTAGWKAYNITSDHDTGVGGWSGAELARYLSTGHADGHGTGSGPMGEAVDDSLRYLSDSDMHALVTYLQSIPAMASSDMPATLKGPAPASHRDGVVAGFDERGKHLFAGACASCHDWTGVSPILPYATLTGARAVNDPSATNVAQIIILGTRRQTARGASVMPAFGSVYSDSEIAALANYVTARFGAN